MNISKALIFDCVYDPYKWVVAYVKVTQGTFIQNQTVTLIHSEKKITITEVGYFDPNYHTAKSINTGEIGYIITGAKSVRDVKIGDTIIDGVAYNNQYDQLLPYAIPGFRRIKPYVFAGVYPVANNEFEKLRDSFEKLSINDSAIEYEYENNKAMGFGFRCGFLGMLHMDIIKERLDREYNTQTIFTIPNVVYIVRMKNYKHEAVKTGTNVDDLILSGLRKHVVQQAEGGKLKAESNNWAFSLEPWALSPVEIREQYHDILRERLIVRSGGDMPANGDVSDILEPIAEVEVVWPSEYYGSISQLCNEARGILKGTEFLNDDRVIRKYEIPLGEIIIDFYDQLKSLTKWYATMNYDFKHYAPGELAKLDILINGEIVEAFSMVVYEPYGYDKWCKVIEKLKELIPRHMFNIPLQAAFGAKIIARETIPAVRKDVLAKCYGWDISRKRKLLEKQKEGKKKMKEIGKVSIPNDIFINMMKR